MNKVPISQIEGRDYHKIKKGKEKGLFPEMFEKKAFNISLTCAALGINRNTYYNWLKKDEIFQQKMINAYETRLDLVETELMLAIKKGNIAAIIFFLKCQGKSRGWIERDEIDFRGQIQQQETKLDFSNMTDEQLDRIEASLKKYAGDKMITEE